MSRDRILNNIRTSLAKTRPQMEDEAARADHTPPPFVHPPEDDLVAQFAAELTRLGGSVHQCADPQAALEIIDEIVRNQQATSVIAWNLDQIDLAGLDEVFDRLGVTLADTQIAYDAARVARLQALEPATLCISGVNAAIAESGTLAVLSGTGRARMASLLAPVHIAVLHAGQIVRGLGEAIALLQQRHGPDVLQDHSNLTFISGPSRTADIEFTLTIGVHGPREIHVVIIA